MRKKLPKTRNPQIEHDPSVPITPLEINGRAYHLALRIGPLKQRGRRVASLIDTERRRIFVSLAVPVSARMEVASLAVCEAWKRETIQRPPLRFVGNVQ
jgi:hypothetical protein